MICPYCHVEYTVEHPCFCQPSASPARPEASAAAAGSRCEEERWQALSPTGLDNPFWKPDGAIAGLRPARVRRLPGPQA